mmetsp:Transcript_28751/g.45489  ORF Transcript_28751/g.45489 Transcript_28751/m.45489 type:complete len:462 (-) Transcript_28751:1692-3077(-)
MASSFPPTSTEALELYDSNNQGVPIAIHVSTTIIVMIVFSVSLEQACSLSIKNRLFKIRVGVLISNAILSVLSIVLNLDLLRTGGHISFLDAHFVLIVRTLQIIWLSLAFFIGYFFVIYSISSAYRSSTLLYSANQAGSESPPNDHSRKIPNWMIRFWLVCTILVEIVIFLCFIIAFSTSDIFYIHICWICSFLFTIIGALLVLSALFDIIKYVYKKTEAPSLAMHDNVTVSANKLNKLNRLLITMMVLCVASITAATINLVTIINHLNKIYQQHHQLQRPGTLDSTAIDNVADYVSYFLILLCVEVSFVIWTYKPNAVNYCLFCCCAGCGHQKYAQSFHLDKSTMCYAFCKACLEDAERKRRAYMEAVQRLQVQPQQADDEQEQPPQAQQPHTAQQTAIQQEAGNASTPATPPMAPRQVTATATQNQMQRPAQFSITAPPASPHQHIVLDDGDEDQEQHV